MRRMKRLVTGQKEDDKDKDADARTAVEFLIL